MYKNNCDEIKAAKELNTIEYLFKFQFDKIAIVILIVILGYFFLANFSCENGKAKVIPSIKTNIEVKR